MFTASEKDNDDDDDKNKKPYTQVNDNMQTPCW